MTTLPLSPAYRDAVKIAIVLQVVAASFLLLVLDGGLLAKVGGVAMVGFWIGAAIVMLRRPRDPSALDLLFVRWGYIALFVVGVAWAESARPTTTRFAASMVGLADSAAPTICQ